VRTPALHLIRIDPDVEDGVVTVHLEDRLRHRTIRANVT
jgi:hypothetical protein